MFVRSSRAKVQAIGGLHSTRLVRSQRTAKQELSAKVTNQMCAAKIPKLFELDNAINFLLRGGDEELDDNPDCVQEYDGLRLPKPSSEQRQCDAILEMIKSYVQRSEVKRPLSIGVFGPPGSGKSLIVKKLIATAEKAPELSHRKFEKARELNLSQFNEPRELSQALLEIFSLSIPDTRVVFFDEFDSELNGKPLGWLKSFLAPMQDGKFYYDGRPIAIGRAVFVFAGGTADRFDDFEDRHKEYFVHRKGPDFVSRLRGFLDIEGINTHQPERYLRRALALQFQLPNRSEELKGEISGTLNIEKQLLRSLLDGGHYRHGARSLEALLDMCSLKEDDEFVWDHLPDERHMALHVSPGDLSDRTIGLAAGQEKAATKFSEQFAKELGRRGATMIYAGSLDYGKTLQKIIGNPDTEELIKGGGRRVRNLMPYPGYLNQEPTETDHNKGVVDFVTIDTLSNEELRDFNVNPNQYFRAFPDDKDDSKAKPADTASDEWVSNHAAWSLSLFRMRVSLIQQSDIFVIVGGKNGRGADYPWGRFPGIIEEVMLALAFNKPTYVVGMAKGAAETVGRLLGLSLQRSSAQNWLRLPSNDHFKKFRKKLRELHDINPSFFQVPGGPELPETPEDLETFFREHGLGTDQFPYNGLTTEENRELFGLSAKDNDLKRCMDLIIRGISRLKWTDDDVPDNAHEESETLT